VGAETFEYSSTRAQVPDALFWCTQSEWDLTHVPFSPTRYWNTANVTTNFDSLFDFQLMTVVNHFLLLTLVLSFVTFTTTTAREEEEEEEEEEE
jgi:hypothetical protein